MLRRRRSWRHALVVGGSEGIGLEVAKQLAAGGAAVTVLGRSAEKLAAAAALVAEASAGQASVDVLTVDVREWTRVQEAVEASVRGRGVPDLVVITAGYARAEWFAESGLDTVRDLVETNLFGTVHVCRAIVPHLVEAGGGTIVTTSSLAGLTGVYGYAGYSASKFAVVGFSEALRRELHPFGIHVTTLCPPNTRTPGLATENQSKPPEVLAAEEKVRTMEAADVARALLRALAGRPRIVIPNAGGRLAHRAVRLAPGIIERILRRSDRGA